MLLGCSPRESRLTMVLGVLRSCLLCASECYSWEGWSSLVMLQYSFDTSLPNTQTHTVLWEIVYLWGAGFTGSI